MATRVQEFPQRTKGTKYPYEEWFDGSKWRLVQGEDFAVAPGSLRTILYNRAGLLGHSATVRFAVETVNDVPNITVAYVQKVDKRAKRTPKPKAKAPAKTPAKPKTRAKTTATAK